MTNTKQHKDHMQSLMDKAYETWRSSSPPSGKEWSMIQFWDLIPPDQRTAVVLGNLNYQVCNGGFTQWADNGYCAALPIIVRALERFVNWAKTKNPDAAADAEEVQVILMILGRDWIDLSRTYSHIGNGLDRFLIDISPESMDDFEYKCSSYNERYWKVNERLMVALDDWMAQGGY